MKSVSSLLIKKVLKSSKICITEDFLQSIFLDISEKITLNHKYDNPIMVCIMNGAFFFTSEILKRLKFPLQMDYIHVTRYDDNFIGSSKLRWLKFPTISPLNRNIILFDDVLDCGITLEKVKNYFQQKGAKQVSTVVMIDKDSPKSSSGLSSADYFGTKVENKFLFGFGLDYCGYFRNLPNIYFLDKKYMS